LLSVHSPAALQKAVESDDADALMLVPGIGRKTATRLLIELKSKLDLDDSAVLAAGGQGEANGGGATRADVRAALAGLGYAPEEIRQALAALPAEGTIEDHLRLALRQIAAGR
jgi:Holliday junction DNA helicase RuvA